MMTEAKHMRRRDFLKVAAALAAAASPLALGQGFPARPLRVLLPYGPTGLPDALARAIAEGLSERLGQAVVVDNRPGASGIIAAQAAMKAEPDGHTLLLVDNNIYGINPAVFAQLPYDPLRDFLPVTQAISGAMFLVANAASGAKSVRELIGLAKARPGMNYGSPGNATLHHLGMEELALRAGLQLTHVPYKGVLQAIPALVTGDVTCMFTSIGPAMAHVKSGKLVVLAVGSPQRSALMPEVPTVAEAAGLAGFEVVTSMGFAVPAGTPAAIVERLNREFVAAMKTEPTATRIARLGMDVVASTPAEFAAQIRKDIAHYHGLVRRTKLKID